MFMQSKAIMHHHRRHHHHRQHCIALQELLLTRWVKKMDKIISKIRLAYVSRCVFTGRTVLPKFIPIRYKTIES